MKNSIFQKDRIGNQKIEEVTEEFTGTNITRFGGVGLIRRFFKRHGIKKEIEDKVKVEGRRESKYIVSSMFMSILYGIFLGQARPSHMEVLAKDKVYVAKEVAILNLYILMRFRNDLKGFKAITLDLDSHVTTVFGNQQRAGIGYNPKKKGRKSYHNAIPFLKEILKKLPSHIKKIRVRMDSGFFSIDMLRFLVKNSIEFYVVVPIQPWVQRKIIGIRDWRCIGGGVEVSECEYVLNKDITVRMVVIRQRVKNEEPPRKQLKLLNTDDAVYNYQVIATNGTIEPVEVWRFYNKRATVENFIKEGIYGFGLDKVVSHSYAGNYTWFELLMLAYNLMNLFKEEVLGQEKVKNMIQTIKERLFLIPGRLVYTSGR